MVRLWIIRFSKYTTTNSVCSSESGSTRKFSRFLWFSVIALGVCQTLWSSGDHPSEKPLVHTTVYKMTICHDAIAGRSVERDFVAGSALTAYPTLKRKDWFQRLCADSLACIHASARKTLPSPKRRLHWKRLGISDLHDNAWKTRPRRKRKMCFHSIVRRTSQAIECCVAR